MNLCHVKLEILYRCNPIPKDGEFLLKVVEEWRKVPTDNSNPLVDNEQTML